MNLQLKTKTQLYNTWAFPLKTKTGSDVIKIFDKIFKDDRVPIKLQSDGGREFNNFTFKKYLKGKSIQYFTTENETKCSTSLQKMKPNVALLSTLIKP